MKALTRTTMIDTLYPFINCIESLSKSNMLREGDVFPYVRQVLIESSEALNCERVNVWMLEENDTVLANLLSYDRRKDEFELQPPLKKEAFPHYFTNLLVDEIIVANNAATEPKNEELVAPYILPNGIRSMIDVPLRTDGKMFGVICYEKLTEHEWQLEEQKFVQSIAQLLSLALETQKRKKLQQELQVILDQKNLLLAEIKHRTKNNNSVILSMINLMKGKVKDEYHELLFEQLSNRVYSLAAVQDQLSATDNFERVDLYDYLHNLIQKLKESFPKSEIVETSVHLEHIDVPLKQATSIGLILNEAVTNVYKYAFDQTTLHPTLLIELKKLNGNFRFVIIDNGKGLNTDEKDPGLGFDLMHDLAEQIDSTLTVNSLPGEGCAIELVFRPETD